MSFIRAPHGLSAPGFKLSVENGKVEKMSVYRPDDGWGIIDPTN